MSESRTNNSLASKLAALLKGAAKLAPRSDVLGSSASTYAIGGPFEAFLEIEDASELEKVSARLSAEGLTYRVIGAGSNLLLASGGIPGLTLRLGRGFRFLSPVDGVGRFRVGASMSLMTLSRELSEQGFSGLEFAGGIPASLGGAVVMNAGAHSGDMAGVIESVRVLLPGGQIEELRAEALRFAYRHSELPSGAVVLEALLRVVPGSRDEIAARRREYLAERKRRQPLQSPSAGSVFRNPSPQESAGILLDRAGLKGYRLGGAQVSLLHANWIVNDSRKATDSDVRGLIEICQKKVREAFQIELKPEVIFWGSEVGALTALPLAAGEVSPRRWAEDFEVRPSPISGQGLFSKRRFQRGEVVLRWDTSVRISKTEVEKLPLSERSHMNPFDHESFVLMQAPERFVNHSCGSNTRVQQLCDVAVRDIQPGEEITSDYRSAGAEIDFVCNCGSEGCSAHARPAK